MPATDVSIEWNVAVDTGGTFTDCIAVHRASGLTRTSKVLSTSAVRGVITRVGEDGTLVIGQNWNANADFAAGLTFRTLGPAEKMHGTVISFSPHSSRLRLDSTCMAPHGAALAGRRFELWSDEESPILAARLAIGRPSHEPLNDVALRLATTKATNALLERSYARAALITNKGHGDLLRIGTQQRPDLFAIDILKPPAVTEDVFEIDARLRADGASDVAVDHEQVAMIASQLHLLGIRTVAIALMHSDFNPAHELQVEEILRQAGVARVSCSHRLAPFVGLLARAQTAAANAALEPILQAYLNSIEAGLSRTTGERPDSRETREGRAGAEQSLLIMTSAGGLVRSNRFDAIDGLLSGPAGGVVGAAHVAAALGFSQAIGFDMGGTSTDVSRLAEHFELAFEHEIGGTRVLAPTLDIQTIAAGGGSICSFALGRLSVGPESAGASPGPACYGQGGPMTLTDVNLLLGRVDVQSFGVPLDVAASERRLDELRSTIEGHTEQAIGRTDLLEGLVNIADEKMAGAIRSVTTGRGHDPQGHALVAFGGAGGQHACGVADRLGITTVIVPAHAGVLSAQGLAHSKPERFAQRQVLRLMDDMGDDLVALADVLAGDATRQVCEMLGDSGTTVRMTRRIASMRMLGQSTTIECEWPLGMGTASLRSRFLSRYRAVFGYTPESPRVEVVSLRVIAAVHDESSADDTLVSTAGARATPARCLTCSFGGQRLQTDVFERRELSPGDVITGPAMLIDESSTSVIPPGWQGLLSANLDLVLRRDAGVYHSSALERPEAIEQALFTSRLEGIAQEMGHALARTAVSTNVKERLDFSCAVLDADGELIANAPHVPVHLGSLGVCVRAVAQRLPIGEGDVVVTNHPAMGGSHLPDITVITGVFCESGALAAYVASRAHHAEIGGLVPGSMPAHATALSQEGVVIEPCYLVRGGKAQWDTMRCILEDGPHPTRAIEENLADLRAQLAANERGCAQLRALVHDTPMDTFRRRMAAIKDNAERLLVARLTKMGDRRCAASERLDDGSMIELSVHTSQGKAVIDFDGTSGDHPQSLNATPAIVRSCVLYVLRLLVDEDIPLNEGLMRAVDLRIPRGMLNPTFDANPGCCPAVAGGNVETSQRVVDALVSALGLAAGSQGTMNNVTVGGETWGFYETICGGAGATANAPGAHAVHTHMTNTRITDAEVLERRYPVRLESFEIRPESGGDGKHRGGNGAIRRMRFLDRALISLLTQHRKIGPNGAAGGLSGAPGRQWIERTDGSKEMLAHSAVVDVKPGDVLVVESPGGGGWGNPRRATSALAI
jgi:5-oxoprolinase (ATP-hydrolysing)